MTAKALGFDRPTANSLDSVADRDFALEALSAAAICGDPSVALRRGDRAVDDAAVRLRAPLGRLLDRLVDHAAEAQSRTRPNSCAARRAGSSARWSALLTVMKGLPLAYSKDMQEDKEGVFDALETLSLCARRDDRHGQGPDAGRQADEGGGGRGLCDRDRPRRLAGARR